MSRHSKRKHSRRTPRPWTEEQKARVEVWDRSGELVWACPTGRNFGVREPAIVNRGRKREPEEVEPLFRVYSDQTGEWLNSMRDGWTRNRSEAGSWPEERADTIAGRVGDGDRWSISLVREAEPEGQSALPRHNRYSIPEPIDPKAVDCPYCVKRPRKLRDHCRAVHPDKPEAR